MESKLVAVTTIQYGTSSDANQKIRSEVFLDTAERLQTADIPCLAIAGPCPPGYIQKAQELGVRIVSQKSFGMGNARREALRAGSEYFPAATHYLWLEPEKSDLPRHVLRLWRRMCSENTVLGLFNRIEMESYPAEQAYYYLFCRAVATSLLGFDLDYAFGPMIVTKLNLRFFLDYEKTYGDLWDSILIPRIRMIHAGLGFSIEEAAFQNDPRMSTAESGEPQFILKRIDQFNNVVRSLVFEWQELHQ